LYDETEAACEGTRPVFPFDDQQRRDVAVYVLKEHP